MCILLLFVGICFAIDVTYVQIICRLVNLGCQRWGAGVRCTYTGNHRVVNLMTKGRSVRHQNSQVYRSAFNCASHSP